MNTVCLVGRLTKDPDVRYGGANNTAVARFTLAVDRGRKGADGTNETDFITCKAFGKQAEVIEKYVAKGHRLGVEGRIETGSYDNKEGRKVYTTEVVATRIELMESKNSGNAAPKASAQAAPADDFMDVPEDEEIPY